MTNVVSCMSKQTSPKFLILLVDYYQMCLMTFFKYVQNNAGFLTTTSAARFSFIERKQFSYISPKIVDVGASTLKLWPFLWKWIWKLHWNPIRLEFVMSKFEEHYFTIKFMQILVLNSGAKLSHEGYAIEPQQRKREGEQ